ncbi:arginase family protein [Agrococcus sp. SGAir0287]|uniref:arginase family protein n=1 Tax=Agrococcus sp. SGAir0287 TaxID=2070347 RepID=UPI0020C7FA15|nr:arginase family protein [Agrococcus sp. SGAir0287]
MPEDVRQTARSSRDAMHVDPLWPRAGGWPDLGDEPVDAVLVGLGTHATSISPTGAHATPLAVREALARFAPHAAGADLDALRVADAGDAADPDGDEDAAAALVERAVARSRLAIVLGGDNAATVPAALGSWRGVGVAPAGAGLVTLDAHHDLRDGRSNGSPVRRLVEAGLSGARIVQVGIQDFANSRAYADRAADLGIAVETRAAVEEEPVAAIVERALTIAGGVSGPIHVDVDVDVVDRAAAPGCPASMPGGISAWRLRALVRALARDPRVRSLDLTEVDATADAADGRTVRLAALCVLEALAGLAERER